VTETEARQPEHTWRLEPSLGGLYRLFLDGEPGYATALVDRNLSRSEQLQALGELDWIPAHPLSAIFEKTMAGQMSAPWTKGAFAGERLLTPFSGNLPVYVDVDDPPPAHPVSDYLWPGVTPSFELRLEPGEEVVRRWSMMRPTGVLLRPNGQIAGASLDPWPSTYIREVVGYITNRRIAIVGHLHLPNVHREDYSLKLAFVSPALDDLRATVRQVRRWRERKNISWCLHIRHEWLTAVQYGSITPPGKQRKIFHSRAADDQARQLLKLAVTWPSRARPTITLTHVSSPDEPSSTDLFEALQAEVGRAVPEAHFTDKGGSSTETPGGMLLTRKDLQETQTFTIDGTVPYSLPGAFAQGRETYA
jgi:hypothetical protein